MRENSATLSSVLIGMVETLIGNRELRKTYEIISIISICPTTIFSYATVSDNHSAVLFYSFLRRGQGVIRAVMKEWTSLSSWWRGSTASNESKMAALTLLTKLLLIDSKAVVDIKNPAFYHIFKMFITFLSKENPLTFKVLQSYFHLITEENNFLTESSS
jgi:hypothetical protein